MLFYVSIQNQEAMVIDYLKEFSNEYRLDINLAKFKLYISPNI